MGFHWSRMMWFHILGPVFAPFLGPCWVRSPSNHGPWGYNWNQNKDTWSTNEKYHRDMGKKTGKIMGIFFSGEEGWYWAQCFFARGYHADKRDEKDRISWGKHADVTCSYPSHTRRWDLSWAHHKSGAWSIPKMWKVAVIRSSSLFFKRPNREHSAKRVPQGWNESYQGLQKSIFGKVWTHEDWGNPGISWLPWAASCCVQHRNVWNSSPMALFKIKHQWLD